MRPLRNLSACCNQHISQGAVLDYRKRHPHRCPHKQQHQHLPRRLQPCCASNNSTGHNADPTPGHNQPLPPPQQHQAAAAPQAVAELPAIMDGINWYCYSCLGLLFLTDFSPVGQWLLASPGYDASSFPLRLALLQWTVFVLPTLAWAKRSSWKLTKTLKLQPSTARYYITGLLLGPALWLAINAAVALRTGSMPDVVSAWTHGAPSIAAAGAAADGAISPGMMLLGVGNGGTPSIQQVLLLLLFAAASPAVAEELLFRGLLLTAVQQRLGSIDAVAVVAALFALIHLDLQQFFLYCVLGGACGLITIRSGSVGPAVALHATFNATAVLAGLLLHR